MQTKAPRALTLTGALFAVLAIAVAGCSSSQPAEGQGATSGTSTSGDAPETDAAPDDAGDDADGATSDDADSNGGDDSYTGKIIVAQATATMQAGSGLSTVMAAGMQEGFFPEGMQVEMPTNNGSTAAIQSVATKSADVGFADLGSAFQAYEFGVPIKVLGSIVINFPWKMATLPGSGITKPEDLKGKTIGIISLASASYSYTQNYLNLIGLTEDDVKLIPVGVGAAAGEALKNGDVEVLALYEILYAQLENLGFNFEYLPNDDFFSNLVSISLITHKDFVDSRRGDIEAFMKGLYASSMFTAMNPEKAVLDSFEQFPDWLTGSSVDELLAPSTESVAAFMQSVVPKGVDLADVTQWGDITPLQWESTTEFELTRGGITNEIPMNDLYQSDFLAAANDFDRSDVTAKAE